MSVFKCCTVELCPDIVLITFLPIWNVAEPVFSEVNSSVSSDHVISFRS